MKYQKIHFVGVGGVGMGTFAVALAKSGHQVTGSDGALYEPMKGVLKESKIQLFEGFKKEWTETLSPDLVIIGNVVRKDNEEASAWIQKGTKFMSFPEAVRTLMIQDKHSIVCSGTHGKTTTTSWISFLLRETGIDPTYLIGGVPTNLPSGCHLSTGGWFVGEGDEYDSAFFDKGPKFLHYYPHFAVISSIEFDHADIYRDLDHVKASFEKLVALLPGDGLCVARYDDPVVMEVAGTALCPIQTFGLAPGAMWKLGKVVEDEKGFEFEVIYKSRSIGNFRTPLFGEHNLINLVSGIVVAVNMGINIERIRPVVEKFEGVKRRQEILSHGPIRLIDDFAHHPTEVAATLKAVRRRYPSGKLWALFEPRSATARRKVHQDEYPKSLGIADGIFLSTPHRAQELKQEERFSGEELATSLTETGKLAKCFSQVDEIVSEVTKMAAEGDTIVVMSNGEFGKIQEKLRKTIA